MKAACLTASRLAISFWVGAALIFVVTSIQEVSSDEINSEIRSILAAMRFPTYYLFGFFLVGFSFLTGSFLKNYDRIRKIRWWFYMGLLSIVLIVMVVDYIWIFRPLLEMVILTEQARSAKFRTYHELTKYINLFNLLLCLVAAGLINLPVKKS